MKIRISHPPISRWLPGIRARGQEIWARFLPARELLHPVWERFLPARKLLAPAGEYLLAGWELLHAFLRRHVRPVRVTAHVLVIAYLLCVFLSLFGVKPYQLKDFPALPIPDWKPLYPVVFEYMPDGVPFSIDSNKVLFYDPDLVNPDYPNAFLGNGYDPSYVFDSWRAICRIRVQKLREMTDGTSGHYTFLRATVESVLYQPKGTGLYPGKTVAIWIRQHSSTGARRSPLLVEMREGCSYYVQLAARNSQDRDTLTPITAFSDYIMYDANCLQTMPVQADGTVHFYHEIMPGIPIPEREPFGVVWAVLPDWLFEIGFRILILKYCC